VAVLGLLDDASLRALTAVHQVSFVQQAVALLLDVGGWGGPGTAVGDRAERSAQVLAAAGWQVVVVSRGESLPAVWRRLAERGIGARNAAWSRTGGTG
jgi:hypothetical protein